MVSGRPAGTKLDPDTPSPVSQEVGEIDWKRRRILISPRLTGQIPWFEKGPFKCLMVFSEPGQIVLWPWDEDAEKVIAKRRELIENKEESGNLDALRWLEDQYHRLEIPQDRRIPLKPEALLHLGISAHSRSKIYIVSFPDRIELMSSEYRNKLLSRVPEELDVLPYI